MTETDFVFSSYRNLKKNLGKFDAIVECNEIAIRHFISKAKEKDDPRDYISNKSDKYNIRVNDVSLKDFSVRPIHWYILSVYQQAESFLRSLKKEHPRETWPAPKDGESNLDFIIRSFGVSDKKIDNNIVKGLILVFSHYRLVGNRFRHTNIKDGRVSKSIKKIEEAGIDIEQVYGVQAPNPYDQMDFDDFILCTRVTSDIARWLCGIARPSDEEIVDMLFERESDPESDVQLSNLKKFSNNPDRFHESLSKLIEYEFALEPPESDPVVKLAKDRILWS